MWVRSEAPNLGKTDMKEVSDCRSLERATTDEVLHRPVEPARLAGQMEASTNFSGNRVNQDLTA